MKKMLVITAAVVVLFGSLYFYMSGRGRRVNTGLAAGGAPENFILGMKGPEIYRLNDIIGRYVIVLAFLDSAPPSVKFLDMYRSRLWDYILSRPDIIWFNIKKDEQHAVIEEQTEHLNLMYRTPYSSMPDLYDFKNMPAVLIIDKKGVIKLVYSGYSPTIFSDLRDGLAAAAK